MGTAQGVKAQGGGPLPLETVKKFKRSDGPLLFIIIIIIIIIACIVLDCYAGSSRAVARGWEGVEGENQCAVMTIIWKRNNKLWGGNGVSCMDGYG